MGQIIPWNFPLLMASWNGSALAAGNCVVLKPARLTPLSVLLLMEIVGDLLPPGVAERGQWRRWGNWRMSGDLETHARRGVLPAQREVGQQIMQYATQNIIPTLELGGKSPTSSLLMMDEEDAFFDKALEGFAPFAFNQGEVCTCPSRALAQSLSTNALWNALSAVSKAFAAVTRSTA